MGIAIRLWRRNYDGDVSPLFHYIRFLFSIFSFKYLGSFQIKTPFPIFFPICLSLWASSISDASFFFFTLIRHFFPLTRAVPRSKPFQLHHLRLLLQRNNEVLSEAHFRLSFAVLSCCSFCSDFPHFLTETLSLYCC